MAGPTLAHIKELRLDLGAAPLFEGAEFVLHKGERAAFVGANGAGKSTLMRMMAGLVEPDGGEIGFATGASIAWAPQETTFDGFATLRDYVMSPSARSGASVTQTPSYAADAALESFGLDPERTPTGLSGGQMRRASLARAFAADADILLLDEPTNHLDIAAIEDLERRLNSFRGAALIISHDRRFLERVSTSTLWLRQRRVIKLDRGFEHFEPWAEAIELEEARALARLETHLKAEEHWLQRGVTARRSRNEGRRRKLMAMRAERRDRQTAATRRTADIQAERGAESARRVIEVKGLSKSYGDTPLIAHLSLRLMRGDRLGIVGANGSGKTTLIELLLQRREPDTGSVRLGEGLQIAYVDQTRGLLDETATIWETLAPLGGDQIIVRGHPRHVAAYAKDFLFGPEQLRQPVSALSGGERNRLSLAVALAQPANVLVLDEPTNDLDMDTLDALEDMLASYDGTVILVSHDRAFLDGVATQIVGPLGDGKWAETPGGWADFERAYGGVSLRPARAETKASPPPAQSPKKQTKLAYKDERRLTELNVLMPKLAGEIAALEQRLADPDIFARDPNAYNAAATQLAGLRDKHAAAESEWLDIELKREAFASEG